MGNPFRQTLPTHPLTVEELATLYAKALEKIDSDPVSGYRICPNCSAGKERFLKKYKPLIDASDRPERQRPWTAFMGPKKFVIECGNCGYVLKEEIQDDPTYI